MLLICGASGLVGKELCSYLDEKGVSYVGTYNKNLLPGKNMFRVDFSNPTELKEFLVLHDITCCIFCIVERLTDKCENNWAEIKKTNVDLVHITSYLCNQLNIRFIHLSTDYVFDGSTQPNFPDSPKNPLQNYGISKLISECRVLANCPDACIIRTPVLYSPYSLLHDNAVCLIGKNVMDLRETMKKEDHYSIRRPLYIRDLCPFIYDCYNQGYRGIYHFYNPNTKYTKYEIAVIIGAYLDVSMNTILPIVDKSGGLAPRPYDTQLCDDKIVISDSYVFTEFIESIAHCFGKFRHPKLCMDNHTAFFICLDMDGTILDTNMAHYRAYQRVFERRGVPMMDLEEWNHTIMNDHIDHSLRGIFGENEIDAIKREKREELTNENIAFTKNADRFLSFLIDNQFNFCVVTNTSKETVDIFKHKLPLLNKISQWIYRRDYSNPKPDRECYDLAIKRYFQGEPFILGFEDSKVGYSSLKHITDRIYFFQNTGLFRDHDGYLFNDFEQIMNGIRQ
jgi:dTDP-4-dehydrorhamnose reductase